MLTHLPTLDALDYTHTHMEWNTLSQYVPCKQPGAIPDYAVIIDSVVRFVVCVRAP